MTQEKIIVKDLRRIIKEELAAVNEAAKTQAVHAAKAAVSSAASRLMAAIDDFKESATPSAMSSVMPLLGELEKMLDHMNDAPGAYIEKPKVEPKKVSLKAVKD